MRLLLVEDDPTTSKTVEIMLTHAGFVIYTTDLGEEAINLAKLYNYDLIILDINLPDISGHEVLRQLRAGLINTPIVMLSGDDSIESKIKAFGNGADDYITKPFHRDDLIARVHSIIRRSKGYSQSLIKTGDLEVNLDSKMVSVKGVRVHLTTKEYAMLEFMSLRKGMVLTKEILINHLYGDLDQPELKIIDIFVCKLRKKLSAHMECNLIETVWGRGYVMRDPEVTAA